MGHLRILNPPRPGMARQDLSPPQYMTKMETKPGSHVSSSLACVSPPLPRSWPGRWEVSLEWGKILPRPSRLATPLTFRGTPLGFCS